MPLTLDGNGDITGLVTGALPSTVIGAGAVLQVVSATSSTVVTTTGTATALLSPSITPSSTSNKILILTSLTASIAPSTNNFAASFLFRGSTSGTTLQLLYQGNQTAASSFVCFSHAWLDSPSTISSQTYTLAFNRASGGTTSVTTESAYSMVLMEIAA